MTELEQKISSFTTALESIIAKMANNVEHSKSIASYHYYSGKIESYKWALELFNMHFNNIASK